MNLPDRHEIRTPGGQDRIPITPEEKQKFQELVNQIRLGLIKEVLKEKPESKESIDTNSNRV